MASTYGYFVGATLVGVPFTPQPGHTIAQDQPGMSGWRDMTAALGTTPAAAAGYTATFAQDGSVSTLTAPAPAPAPGPAVYTNPQPGAYTLASTDINGLPVVITSATPVQVTIPAGLPPGSARIVQGGLGAVTAVAGSGATLTAPLGALSTSGINTGMLVQTLSATSARITGG